MTDPIPGATSDEARQDSEGFIIPEMQEGDILLYRGWINGKDGKAVNTIRVKRGNKEITVRDPNEFFYPQ